MIRISMTNVNFQFSESLRTKLTHQILFWLVRPEKVWIVFFSWEKKEKKSYLSTSSLTIPSFQGDPKIFTSGFSSNNFLILRIKSKIASTRIKSQPRQFLKKSLALFASPWLRLVPASMQGKWACFVSQVRWKERRKG